MKIQSNSLFKEMLKEYKLPDDFSFKVNLPKDVKDILNAQIIKTDLGIFLKGNGVLYPARKKHENKSNIEDFQNHFHVDWHIEPPNDKKVFMLGVKTLYLLAEKFEMLKISGVRFWYSFQTPELAKVWCKSVKLEDDGEHYLSDRLSFYTRRKDEKVIEIEKYQNSFLLY